jgi:hypothetical protein
MKLSKSTKIIVGFILWPLIIAIPQFNSNYATGLLIGKLNYGEIPVEFYLGLVSGIFAALLFWGLSLLLSKILFAITKMSFKESTIFFVLSIIFFSLTLLIHGNNLYKAFSLDEKKVNAARELLKQHETDKPVKGN